MYWLRDYRTRFESLDVRLGFIGRSRTSKAHGRITYTIMKRICDYEGSNYLAARIDRRVSRLRNAENAK